MSNHSKIEGLSACGQILAFLAALTACIFALSLFNDFISIFGFQLIQIETKVYIFFGYILSFLSCFQKYEINNYFAFFPLFGCLMFTISTFLLCRDLDLLDNEILRLFFLILILFFGSMTIYHRNWLISIFTITSLYSLISFGFYPSEEFLDSDTHAAIQRSYYFGYFLIPFSLLNKFSNYKYWESMKYFESGCLFWGTFLSCLSILFLSIDEYYNLKNSWVSTNLSLALFYLGLLYVGNLYKITSITKTVGTFSFFWLLDMQTVLCDLNELGTSIYLGLLLLDVFLIRKLIVDYPDFFVFGKR